MEVVLGVEKLDMNVNPKSARRAWPWSSIRIFAFRREGHQSYTCHLVNTYGSHIPVYNALLVEIG